MNPDGTIVPPYLERTPEQRVVDEAWRVVHCWERGSDKRTLGAMMVLLRTALVTLEHDGTINLNQAP